MSHGHNAFWKDDREVPDTWSSAFVFEERNCTVTYEGSMNSKRAQSPEYIGRSGRLIYSAIGQDASMFEIYGDETAQRLARHPRLEPSLFFAPGKEHRRADHMQEFLDCVRSREKTRCNEDEAFIETATLSMALAAFHQKRQVRWDRAKEEIVLA
jgi:hypothetical protein